MEDCLRCKKLMEEGRKLVENARELQAKNEAQAKHIQVLLREIDSLKGNTKKRQKEINKLNIDIKKKKRKK